MLYKLNFRVFFLKFICSIAIVLLFISLSRTQYPSPTPTPPEEMIKVYTEEVNLNVTAQTDSGKFVPSLKADDLLVVEEGTPQTINAMKRVPANVLLLLNTGLDF